MPDDRASINNGTRHGPGRDESRRVPVTQMNAATCRLPCRCCSRLNAGS